MGFLTWLGRAAAFGGGVLVAVACGTAALLLVATSTTQPAVFVTSGMLAGLCGWLLVWLLLRRSPALSRPAVAGAGALLVVAILGSSLVPLNDPVVAPRPAPGAGTWQTADGGRLAHGVVRAPDHAPDRSPVIVLHGGPGVPDTAGLLEVFGPLAELGHDVWAYDQRGTGRSSRLTDPSGYGTELDLADLDEVRRHIDAERVILVGHSYGANLAAAYVADHPGRVERAVFLSPGDLVPGRAAGDPQDRLTGRQRWQAYRLFLSPRALVTYGLVQVNPAAAHAFAGDREVDAREDLVYAKSVPALHCPGRTGPALHGTGFYANVVPSSRRQGPSTSRRSSTGRPCRRSSSRVGATTSTGSRPPATWTPSRTAACSTCPTRGTTSTSTSRKSCVRPWRTSSPGDPSRASWMTRTVSLPASSREPDAGRSWRRRAEPRRRIPSLLWDR